MGWVNSFFNNITVTNNISFNNGFLSNGDGTFSSTPAFLLYSGTPAAGNLIYSESNIGGTDKFGNVYVSGQGNYLNGTPSFCIQIASGNIQGRTSAAPNPGAVWNATSLLITPNAGAEFQLDTTPSDLTINNKTTGGTTAFNVNANSTATLRSSSGDIYGLGGSRSTAQSGGPVTGITFGNLYSASIAAGDALLNTGWRLTAGGFGTWGSTAQDLTLGFNIYSQDICDVIVRSQEFAVSTNFDWRIQGEFMVRAAGAAGTLVATMSLEAGADGTGQLSQINSINSAIGGASKGSAGPIDLTGATNALVRAKWASTTGAPTITGTYFILERIGA